MPKVTTNKQSSWAPAPAHRPRSMRFGSPSTFFEVVGQWLSVDTQPSPALHQHLVLLFDVPMAPLQAHCQFQEGTDHESGFSG